MMKLFKAKYRHPMDMLGRTYRNVVTFSNPTSIAILLFSFLLLLSSCEKNDQAELPPSIQLINQTGIISTDTTIAFGDLMTFTIKATGGSTNLTNLYVLRSGTQMDQTRALDTSMNLLSFEIDKSFTKNLADEEYFTFIIRDKNRLSDSVSVIIHRDSTTDFGPILYIESMVMSAQNLQIPGSFFSIEKGVQNQNQAFQNQEIIDLLYYYYGEDENVIASPGANIESGVFVGDLDDWTTRRTTRFIELDLPAEDFYTAENDSLLVVSYNEGSGKRKAKNLTPGKTFSFKTQDSKFGIFRILEVEGTDAGTIKMDLKIQDK